MYLIEFFASVSRILSSTVSSVREKNKQKTRNKSRKLVEQASVEAE